MSSVDYAEEFRKRRDSFKKIAETIMDNTNSHQAFISSQIAGEMAEVCELLAKAGAMIGPAEEDHVPEETADPTEPESGFDEHCHCNRGVRTTPNGTKYCPKHGHLLEEDVITK